MIVLDMVKRSRADDNDSDNDSSKPKKPAKRNKPARNKPARKPPVMTSEIQETPSLGPAAQRGAKVMPKTKPIEYLKEWTTKERSTGA